MAMGLGTSVSGTSVVAKLLQGRWQALATVPSPEASVGSYLKFDLCRTLLFCMFLWKPSCSLKPLDPKRAQGMAPKTREPGAMMHASRVDVA